MDEEQQIPNIAQNAAKPKVKRKRARSSTEKIAVNKERYKFLQPFKDSCYKKCSEKFLSSDYERKNNTFWSMTFEGCRLWLDGHIYIGTVNRYRTSYHRKHHTLMYSLPNESSKITVCKNMFLATLGMKGNAYIRGFVNGKLDSVNAGNNSYLEDHRGPHSCSKQSQL